MRAEGVIRAIARAAVPSLFAEVAPREVARIELAFDRLTSDEGAPLDPRTLLGLAFEGPPELAATLHAGDRVALTTTTPTGMHIATIEKITLH